MFLLILCLIFYKFLLIVKLLWCYLWLKGVICIYWCKWWFKLSWLLKLLLLCVIRWLRFIRKFCGCWYDVWGWILWCYVCGFLGCFDYFDVDFGGCVDFGFNCWFVLGVDFDLRGYVNFCFKIDLYCCCVLGDYEFYVWNFY